MDAIIEARTVECRADRVALWTAISDTDRINRAVGMSNYDALQFNITKRMSHGLQVSGSYTYSHTLDEQSGLG